MRRWKSVACIPWDFGRVKRVPKLSFELGLAIAGIILTLLLPVLDKAGLLKGGFLLWLLVVAALLTLPLAIGNSFVASAVSSWRWWLRAVALAVVGLSYWAIAILILPATRVESKTSTPPAPREAAATEPGTIQLSLTCDTISLPMPYRGDLWLLDTIFLKGLGKYSPNPMEPAGIWPEPGVYGTGFPV
jgi:hypothetical protein